MTTHNSFVRHLPLWLAAMTLTATSAQAADGGVTTAREPADASRTQIEQRLQAAQEQLERSAREVAGLSMSLNDVAGLQRTRMIRTGGPRVMLGLGIDMQERGAAPGVRVISVSPGGPAEAAGLKANDIVTAFDGKALRESAGQPAAQQLLGLIREARVDQPVALDYQRDGRPHSTKITPKSLPESMIARLPDLSDLPDVGGPLRDRLVMIQERGSGFGSAELVELSPQLGKYFGTDKGLLVVRAPRDDGFKLQDGDVILDIDGRVPNGVAHAYQILSSYRAREALKMHVMRQQKRVELAVEVPDRSNRPDA
jgi:S1-C subfamily serine protease